MLQRMPSLEAAPQNGYNGEAGSGSSRRGWENCCHWAPSIPRKKLSALTKFDEFILRFHCNKTLYKKYIPWIQRKRPTSPSSFSDIVQTMRFPIYQRWSSSYSKQHWAPHHKPPIKLDSELILGSCGPCRGGDVSLSKKGSYRRRSWTSPSSWHLYC